MRRYGCLCPLGKSDLCHGTKQSDVLSVKSSCGKRSRVGVHLQSMMRGTSSHPKCGACCPRAGQSVPSTQAVACVMSLRMNS